MGAHGMVSIDGSDRRKYSLFALTLNPSPKEGEGL